MESACLPLLFFLVALVYSMAGFGGGSSYLLLLVGSGLSHGAAPQVALLCNLAVVGLGFYRFARAGHFVPRTVLPFLATSIPFAYAASRVSVNRKLFFLLLAASLLIANLRLLFSGKTEGPGKLPNWKTAWRVGLPCGALIGILSGLVGIGGGIFLSPILYLLRWADPRKIAASCSLFILLNSLAGLVGQTMKGGWSLGPEELLPLMGAAFLGGWVGSGLGAKRLHPIFVRRAAAAVLCGVSVQLFWKFL